MTPRAHAVAASLADALLAGSWTAAGCRARATEVVGRRRWVAPLVTQLLARFPAPPLTRRRALIDAIGASGAFAKAMSRADRPSLQFPFLGPAQMGPRRFDVPEVPTVGDLARWLTPDHPGTNALEWLADRRGWLRDRPPGPSHHYRWRWDGARLIEAPKPALRQIQRTILREVLDRVPAHPAAHGFVAGRSPVTFAALHVGQPVVVRLDLRQFFPSIGADRVRAVFRALGYPEGVAGRLAGLCTSRAPAAVCARAPALPDRWATQRRVAAPHLPQGAPTSPSLANLVAWGLDVRLSALARAHGCVYSRYADDLAFSGGFDSGAERFAALVGRIAADEGFGVNPAKTRIRTQAARQVLAGVVVNTRPTVARAEVDALRAVLHNCRVHGPASQNREGHPDWRAVLVGRVGWVRQVDPRRAARLERDLAAIDWDR